MLDMPAGRFIIFNILSALIWAPTYLLPGMVLGTSLALAGEVAGRFALLLVLVSVMAWLSFRIPFALYRYMRPWAGEWSKRAFNWGRHHPVAGYLLKGLADSEKPVSPVLLVFAGLLLGSLWLFFGVAEDVLTGDPLVQASRNLFYFLQNLRTPWGDAIMVACTQLGDAMVTVPVVLAACIWLAWRRAWHSLAYLVTAVVFGAVVVQAMKLLFHVPRPEQLYSGISTYSFPSGHATMSMVIYGFLAVLASQQTALLRRWLPFALAGLLITVIGFSRLYLGAHWLFDIQSLSAQAWWAGGWQSLPAYRLDLEGENEQPLNLQYAGPLDLFEKVLAKHGWRRPETLNKTTMLRWLLSAPRAEDLPVLPQAHQGRHESLILIHAVPGDSAGLFVLRLWPANSTLEQHYPIRTGALNRMQMRRYGLMTILRTANSVPPNLMLPSESMKPLRWKLNHRKTGEQVLLLAWQ